MALQWSSTAQQSADAGVKCLVYSEAGMGKSMLCATAPKPVIISAESGLLSLSRKNLERVYGVGNPSVCYDVPVIQVTNVLQLEEAYQMFANPGSGARNHCSTVCLDSITEIGEQVLASAKAQFKDPRQAYGELIDRMSALVRKFRDLPGYHVYMSAKMELSKDETTGVSKYMPMMPGTKLSQQLPYFFDELFRLGVGKTQTGQKFRYLQTDPDMQYVAKDRSGSLDEMERPDLSYIFNKILGGSH